MLDIEQLRSNIEEITANLLTKNFTLNIDYFQQLESRRKSQQILVEDLQSRRNKLSKNIGILKHNNQDTKPIMLEVNQVVSELEHEQRTLNDILNDMQNFLIQIPNLLDKSVPVGSSDEDNQVILTHGKCRKFDFEILDHLTLGEMLGQIDAATAAKISGSRFTILKGGIAKLHRVLSQFMLEIHTRYHNYLEVQVPYLVNYQSVFNTGQVHKFADALFVTSDNLYLIPTGEVPVTNIAAATNMSLDQLPLKFVAHTPCFRSEAGSYGRDVKGLIRQHQFEKVELVQIVQPEYSNTALDEIVAHAEVILQKLELPYRIKLLCSGDTGFSSAKTYDLEVWMPSQNTYREISSCSNMTDFQARRMLAKYKDVNNKSHFVHTLNGSGLAIGRTLAAIIENYQNPDGSITVPGVLKSYMGCDCIN